MEAEIAVRRNTLNTDRSVFCWFTQFSNVDSLVLHFASTGPFFESKMMAVDWIGLFIDHVRDTCNTEPVKDLLRQAQEKSEKIKKEIRLGVNQEETLKSLRQAIDLNYIPISEALALLNDSEEYGAQHILLLRPVNELLESGAMNHDAVHSKLFLNMQFPKFEYPPSGYLWADFRKVGGESSNDWIAKAYGLESQRIPQGGLNRQELENGLFTESRTYVIRSIRTVAVLRWRAVPGIFEMRISNSQISSSTTIDVRRQAMWDLVSPAFFATNFNGVDVGNLFDSLVYGRNDSKNSAVYSVGSVTFTDPRSGKIHVLPFQADNIDNDESRKNTVEAMKNAGVPPSSIRINLKWDADHTPISLKSDLRAVAFEKTPNGPEFRLQRKINREAYEYVFSHILNRL